jgi:myo-inositol-1(or 4)-monophosphatase
VRLAVSEARRGFDRELAFGLEIAVRAGELQMARYERLERIDRKSARDVVTEVDHLSEAIILDGIRSAFPGDAILAEESGAHASGGGVAPTSGLGRVWVVDPLDGTVNYANGIPFFCVSVALVADGRPVMGVVHDPARGESFAAVAGGPARLHGRVGASRALRASTKEQLGDYVISMSLTGRAAASRARAVRRAVRVPRSMGAAALALAYVAGGRFDALVQEGGLSTWDIAAAGLIAERAGAVVTDLAGGPWFDLSRPPRSIGLLAAPGRHHGALLALARGGPRSAAP